MEKLKVGDVVSLEIYQGWGNSGFYKIDIVERLTKTQAVLSSGTRLINKPKPFMGGKKLLYAEYGNNLTKYIIENPEILKTTNV